MFAAAREIVRKAETDEEGDIPRLKELATAEGYEELFSDWFGGDFGLDGDWGYWENPNTKWDWFVLGGRRQGKLRLLPAAPEYAASATGRTTASRRHFF